MATPFFERPILNSPYKVPTQHHALDVEGQPLDQDPAQGRRRSSLITPVPKSKKQRSKGRQTALGLQERIDTVSDEAELEEVYETERHLLYVAATRVRDRLLINGVRPGSEFLDDLG